MKKTTVLSAEERKAVVLQKVGQYRVMDDVFMRQVFKDDMPLAQHVLRILTGINDLVLEKSETQRDIKSLVGSRSVILDVFGVDSKGKRYDLEVQNGNSVDARRMRYYSAAMDVEYLKPEQDFSALPEQWVIFVMECDEEAKGRGARLFEVLDALTGDGFGDGTHKLVVNGAYRGDNELGRLMADFCQPDPAKIKDALLRERVKYLKDNAKGVSQMSSASEELFNWGRDEGLKQGRDEGAQHKLLENVHSLMETVGWSAQEALDKLKVPKAEQARYLSML
jgi:hypothetical protein